MAGGEGRDEAADAWVGGGGPGAVADLLPEGFLGGEGVELGRPTGGGGECWAVQSGEDVGLEDVRVDGGDRRGIAVGGGGWSMVPSHFFLHYNYVVGC